MAAAACSAACPAAYLEASREASPAGRLVQASKTEYRSFINPRFFAAG